MAHFQVSLSGTNRVSLDITRLYTEWKDDKKIKWKDELKKILGLSSNEKAEMYEWGECVVVKS